jgi:hypothetical protein
LELWQQLTTSAPGVLQNKGHKASAAPVANSGKSNPVDDFIVMENKLSGDLCFTVDTALSALKKVDIICIHHLTFSCLLTFVIGALWIWSANSFYSNRCCIFVGWYYSSGVE